MPKNREKQRENKKAHAEERLDSKTAFGITDSTPREAVSNMIEERKTRKNGSENMH